MQITSCEVSNKKYIQFYLTKEELEREETKAEIEKYKLKKYNVAIFITGKENYPEILQKIIRKRVETSS